MQTGTANQAKPVELDPESVLAHAEDVSGLFRVQMEKGLFCGEDADQRRDKVATLILEAFRGVQSGKSEHALVNIFKAEGIILDAYYLRSKSWRFFHRYQPILVIYYLILLAYMFVLGGDLLGGGKFLGDLKIPLKVWGVPVEVLVFGAGGAALRGLYWLTFKVGRREFRPHFQLAYYLAPIIGALFGALLYALIRAGLWVFQGGEVSSQEPWGVLGLAALAGYSWEWVMEMLDRISKSILTQNPARKSPPVQPANGRPFATEEEVSGEQRVSLPDQPAGDKTSAAPRAQLPDQPPEEAK